jgi:LL-diaminopimelate aminotransferase
MSAVYARRRDLGVRSPQGTIYLCAPVPDGHTSASYCELVLEESAVVVSPGGAYGPNGEGFFRISLTVPDERLSEAMERLRSSVGLVSLVHLGGLAAGDDAVRSSVAADCSQCC